MKTHAALAGAVLCLPMAAWGAQAQSLGCLIEPDRIADVGSPVIGVVETIAVERGDRVRKGQVLAVLRNDVERASVNVATVRAQAEADVRGAQANLEFLRDKQVRAEDLVKRNFISVQALEQARTETNVAEQKLAQAREQQRVTQRELELARAQLELRSIRSPFDGIIAERYVWPGERVEEKALFRVAKVDPLRIEVVVPASLYGTIRTGTLLNVAPELPNAGTLKARVVRVDTLMDAASNTFRARAELPNANAALPSGLRCRAEVVQPASAPAAPPAASRKPAPSPSPAAAPRTSQPTTDARTAGGLKLDLSVSDPQANAGVSPRASR